MTVLNIFDTFGYELHGLTEKEIKVVEGGRMKTTCCKKIITWLDVRLPGGFYFPRIRRLLKKIQEECFSLNYRIKACVKTCKNISKAGKCPPWVSELYQSLGLGLGFVFFLISEWLSSLLNGCLAFLVILLLAYRIFELFVFTLNWIFVHEPQIHNYRRSLMGSLLN